MSTIKAISTIFKVLLYTAVLVLSVSLILGSIYFDFDWAREAREWIVSAININVFTYNSTSFAWGLLLFVFWAIGFISIFIPSDSSNRYVTLEDESGYLHLSIDAIRSFVKDIALSQREVFEAKAKVIFLNGNLKIALRLGVTSKQSIAGVVAILKQEIRSKVIAVCGIGNENIDNIVITIEHIDKNATVSNPPPVENYRGDVTRVRP